MSILIIWVINMPKSDIKVDLKENDVHRYEVIGLTFNTPFYTTKISDDLAEQIIKKMQKLRDKRADWPGYLYMEIRKKMKLVTTGNSLDVSKLHTDEALIAICNTFVDHMNFDSTPKQKTIKEATEKK